MRLLPAPRCYSRRPFQLRCDARFEREGSVGGIDVCAAFLKKNSNHRALGIFRTPYGRTRGPPRWLNRGLYLRKRRARSTMGHGGPPSLPAWTKDVWSPSGGYFPDPRGWRRSTAFVGISIMLVLFPIYGWGERNSKQYPAMSPKTPTK